MRTESYVIYHGLITNEPTFIDSYEKELNRVCIYLDRNELLIWTVWQCFNANITYLLIDQNIPSVRIEHMLNESGIETCITSSKYNGKLPKIKNYILIDEYMDLYKLSGYYGTSPDSYIIFTSGTTGNPKGIIISKKSAISFITNFAQAIGIQPKQKILCIASVNFDIFLVESVLALYKNMDIVIVDENENKSPKKLCEIIMEQKVDILQTTPSKMRSFISIDSSLIAFSKLKKILIGGEPFPPNLLNKMQESLKGEIYNLYGLTETTVWASVGDLTDLSEINIGKPIPSYKIYVLNENLKEVGEGIEGQLAIYNPHLSLGYLNHRELSKEKFVILDKFNERVYLTGDIGKKLDDGNFLCIGRLDYQVKVRGVRIELEEIENVLLTIQEVNHAFAYVEKTIHGEKLIVFYQCTEGISNSAIKEQLKNKLPTYMVPQELIFINDFPITTNGKINRKKVIDDYYSGLNYCSSDIVIEYSDEAELEVMKIIKDNISQNLIKNISVNTEWNELGMDSLMFINVVVAIEERYGIVFDDRLLLDDSFKTIGELIQYVKSECS